MHWVRQGQRHVWQEAGHPTRALAGLRWPCGATSASLRLLFIWLLPENIGAPPDEPAKLQLSGWCSSSQSTTHKGI